MSGEENPKLEIGGISVGEITNYNGPMPQPQPTMAEWLIDLAEEFLFPTDQLIMMPKYTHTEFHVHRVKLAIAFHRKPAAFRLRAIFENWSLDRIIREVY